MAARSKEKSPHWSVYLSIVFSAIALLLSSYTAYKEFWPNDQTIAIVNHVEWHISEGKFGRGPELILGIGLVNRGNAPIIVSSLSASYGYVEGGEAAEDCEMGNQTRWTGIPWRGRLDEDENVDAIPISIPPDIAMPLIYFFHPIGANYVQDKDTELFVCIDIKSLDSQGSVNNIRHPLGKLTFSEESIVKFIDATKMNSPFYITK